MSTIGLRGGVARRRGLTFIEIMLAVLIMAGVMLPIFRFLSSTTGMSRAERTQASAAAFAAKIMSQYLYEFQWTNLVDGGIDGQGWLDNDPKTNVEFVWEGRILDAWPVAQNFAVKRTKYHNACAGACSAAIEDLPRRSPADINPTFVARPTVGGVVLKTIAITFKWKGPGDRDFDNIRTMTLVARRGMLEEANQ